MKKKCAKDFLCVKEIKRDRVKKNCVKALVCHGTCEKVYDCRKVLYYFFRGWGGEKCNITIIEFDVKNVLLQVLGAMGE